MDDGFIISVGVAVFCFFVGLFMGIAIAMPDTLDNGCLVDDGKVYCEKVEVSE